MTTRRTSPRSWGARLSVVLLLLSGAVRTETRSSEAQSPEWHWTGVRRVVAFGDVHGAIDELEALLRATRVIDVAGNWIGGDTHVVSLGDLLDRGADSRRVLDLLMRLEVEAQRAGGGVHTVLGNHETMNLFGDLRYVTDQEYLAFAEEEDPEAREAAYRRYVANRLGPEIVPDRMRAEFRARFPPGYFGHRAAFSPGGTYGRWLLRRPVVIVIDDAAFLHGGLSPGLAELDGAAINRLFLDEVHEYLNVRQQLEDAGLLVSEANLVEQQRALAALLTARTESLTAELLAAARRMQELPNSPALGSEGPVWYRGMAQNPEEAELPNVERVLARLGVDTIVLGHTPTEDRRAQSRFDGRVQLIDTGMLADYYDGRSTALILESGDIRVFYPAEGRYESARAGPDGSGSVPSAPRSMTDEELERFLETAEVVKIEELSIGVTKPKRLTLRHGDLELRAVFKMVDRVDQAVASPIERANTSDRYQYDVAAYRLDRLLGLGMVPVAVLREVDGREGAVQVWVEDAVNERERVERSLVPEDYGPFEQQIVRMQVFDILIYNTDRSQNNLLYTPADEKLHLIDHTRAFRARGGRPKTLQRAEIVLSEELEAALAGLTAKTLEEALGRLIAPIQIKTVLKRRNALLKPSRGP